MRTPLSPREIQVAQLLKCGYTLKEIADELVISPRTVESHKYNIYDKWHIRSRRELIRLMNIDDDRNMIIVVPSNLINENTTVMIGEL